MLAVMLRIQQMCTRLIFMEMQPKVRWDGVAALRC